MRPTLNVIGCGRAGSALVRLWLERDAIELAGICNSQLSSAILVTERLGAGLACAQVNDLPVADLWMLGVPDKTLWSHTARFAAAAKLTDQAWVFHLSGASSSEVLQPFSERGAKVAAIHPLRAFSTDQLTIEQFAETPCVIESRDSEPHILLDLLNAIDAKVISVNHLNRALYHAAAVFSSNFSKTILWTASELFKQAGLSADQAALVSHSLGYNSLQDSSHLGPAASLTGPVERAAADLIAAHLNELSPAPAAAYRSLSALTLQMAKTHRSFTREELQNLDQLLSPDTDSEAD